MSTYLEWDRVVLEECYEQVDAISLHRYFGLSSDSVKDDARYLAMNLEMERQIEDMAAVCDYVRGRKRSAKRLWLSFDEWNVWYRQTGGNETAAAGAACCSRKSTTCGDALVVGGGAQLADAACGPRCGWHAWRSWSTSSRRLSPMRRAFVRQTIYYPYTWALTYAKGRVLDLSTDVSAYNVASVGKVPFVDAAGTVDPATGDIALFVLNRDLERARELRVSFRDAAPARVIGADVLTGANLKAANTLEAASTVVPRKLDTPRPGAEMTSKSHPDPYWFHYASPSVDPCGRRFRAND